MHKPLVVLFLCTGNSARSIMAESLLNKLGGSDFSAYSAGSVPKGRVHPGALEKLRRAGHSLAGLRSKSWDEFGSSDSARIDIIITVCDNAAAETCPVWPGHPVTAHWGIPDPDGNYRNAAEEAEAFDVAYGRLETRISQFLELLSKSQDSESISESLAAIGKLQD